MPEMKPTMITATVATARQIKMLSTPCSTASQPAT